MHVQDILIGQGKLMDNHSVEYSLPGKAALLSSAKDDISVFITFIYLPTFVWAWPVCIFPPMHMRFRPWLVL